MILRAYVVFCVQFSLLTLSQGQFLMLMPMQQVQQQQQQQQVASIQEVTLSKLGLVTGDIYDLNLEF